ncbi:MAG: hypothetical protein LCH76_11285 [Actinobacteria bacterium]|nr:hypothetical protein [Actinomycetota bacterium]
MQWTGEVARGDWLRERLRGWGRVGGVAAGGFAAYARILHPIEADLGAETARWRWADVAARTGTVVHPLVQSRRLFGAEPSELEFPDGWSPRPPQEGFLEPELLARLTAHLSSNTAGDAVTLAIWDGWGELHASGGWFIYFPLDDQLPWWQRWYHRALLPVTRRRLERQHRAEKAASIDPAIARALDRIDGEPGPLLLDLPGRGYVLLTATLTELADPAWPWSAGIGWHGSFSGPMPSLVWPDDHTWCVATEIDFDSTLVGGSRELVDAILSDDTFEAYEVGPDDDLTWDGDTVNPPVG